MKSRKRKSGIGMETVAVLALSMAVGVGCASVDPLPTKPVVRSSGDTAPVELQLTCASEAATRLDVPGDKVLPVSSMPADAGSYQVNLNADGAQAVCFIQTDGTVLSVSRV